MVLSLSSLRVAFDEFSKIHHSPRAMRLIKWVWMVLLSVPISLCAQLPYDTTRPVRSLTLQEALKLALEHNLAIQVGRYRPEIARYQMEATYGVYDPLFDATATHSFREREGTTFNPATGQPVQPSESRIDTIAPGFSGYLPSGLTYDLSASSIHNYGTSGGSPFDNYDTDIGISLRQPLLKDAWIDANRLAIKVAKKDLRISEYTFAFLVMDIISQTQQAYYELIASRDEIVAREKALELAERFAQETRRKVEVGTLPPLEEKLAESQAAQARADLITARQFAVGAENALKTLITDNYELWHGQLVVPTERLLAIPETYDLGASWLNGITLRPDFNQIKEQVEREGYVVKYRQNQLFPQVDLVGTLGRSGFDVKSRTVTIPTVTPGPGPDVTNVFVLPGRDASFSDTLDDIREDRNPRYSYGVVASIPLTLKRERSEYKAAKANFEYSKALLQQKRQEILVQIDNAVSEIRAALQRVEATRQALAYAEAALEAEQKKLEAGRSTSFQVLELQRSLTDARTAAIRALADYNKAIAQLAFAEGTILDRHKIVVEYR